MERVTELQVRPAIPLQTYTRKLQARQTTSFSIATTPEKARLIPPFLNTTDTPWASSSEGNIALSSDTSSPHLGESQFQTQDQDGIEETKVIFQDLKLSQDRAVAIRTARGGSIRYSS